MLDYDGHIFCLADNVTFSFILQPNNTSRRYYAQNLIGFKMGIVIYTEVYMGYVNTYAQKCIGI